MDEENKEVGESDNTGEGDQSETTKVLKQQSERIKELEKERDERALADAKKQMAGTAEGGAVKEKPKEETALELADRIMAGDVE